MIDYDSDHIPTDEELAEGEERIREKARRLKVKLDRIDEAIDRVAVLEKKVDELTALLKEKGLI